MEVLAISRWINWRSRCISCSLSVLYTFIWQDYQILFIFRSDTSSFVLHLCSFLIFFKETLHTMLRYVRFSGHSSLEITKEMGTNGVSFWQDARDKELKDTLVHLFSWEPFCNASMTHRSVWGGLRSKKHIPVKMSGTNSGLERSEKAADAPPNKLWKTFRKPGGLLLKTTLNDYKKMWLLRRKYEEMRAGSRVSNGS